MFADQGSLRKHERDVHKIFRYKCAQMRSILTHDVNDVSGLRIARKDGTVVTASSDDVGELRQGGGSNAASVAAEEIDESELVSPSGRTRRRAAVR